MSDDFLPVTPHDLLALDLTALVGRPVEDARQVVEAAGGRLRTVAPGGALTMDYRPDRVTLEVIDDLVTAVHGLG